MMLLLKKVSTKIVYKLSEYQIYLLLKNFLAQANSVDAGLLFGFMKQAQSLFFAMVAIPLLQKLKKQKYHGSSLCKHFLNMYYTNKHNLCQNSTF